MASVSSKELLKPIICVGLGPDAQYTLHIDEHDGDKYIVISSNNEMEEGGPYTIEIPSGLLYELKHAVTALEAFLLESKESDDEPGVFFNSTYANGFAHPSEEEFARILDFYRIKWEYEPSSFAIDWDDYGEPSASFTPDFFLPDYDLYIELTTQKQALVTKKNRKVRRLRELYPEINIKVLYASDYKKLIEKFIASGMWQDQEDRVDPVEPGMCK